jgi:hypothetical protein
MKSTSLTQKDGYEERKYNATNQNEKAFSQVTGWTSG